MTEHPISLAPATPRERDRLAAYYRTRAWESYVTGDRLTAALLERHASLVEQGGRAQWDLEGGSS